MAFELRQWQGKFEGQTPAIIVDIDGTVAKRGSRPPFDFSRVSEDEPDYQIIELVWMLEHRYPNILFVTARGEECYYDTLQWLEDHLHLGKEPPLFMRKPGDNREDADVKSDIYENNIKDHYNVEYVLDDREGPVRMWRGKGLVCLQVADGEKFY